jgi:hypothetical protein
MHRDRDFDLAAALPWNAAALAQDLELGVLWNAMAGGDKFLYEIAQRAVLLSERDPDTILYRQDVLRDCLEHPEIARRLYEVAVEANEGRRQFWWGLSSRYPSSILHESVSLLGFYVKTLRKLRAIADEQGYLLRSEGFQTLFRTLQAELGDNYFAVVETHLRNLRFSQGALVTAELGPVTKASTTCCASHKVARRAG